MAVLRVTDAFAYSEKNGVQRVLRPGDLVDDNDPAVKGREIYFEPVEATVDRTTFRKEQKVEQATAAPGEARAAKKPAATVQK